MKTSSKSESEVFLPDGQVVRLLFWVEDTGGETLQQTAKMVERDDLATEEDETVKKKNTNKNKNKKRKGRDASEEKNHDKSSTISITYSVSGLQYQSISFNASEHNVWLSALFNYNVSNSRSCIQYSFFPSSLLLLLTFPPTQFLLPCLVSYFIGTITD